MAFSRFIAGVERVEDLGRAVTARIVDEENLELFTGRLLERRDETADERVQVLALVVDRKHNRDRRDHRHPGRCGPRSTTTSPHRPTIATNTCRDGHRT